MPCIAELSMGAMVSKIETDYLCFNLLNKRNICMCAVCVDGKASEK